MDPYNHAEMQMLYRSQVASVVFAPANRTEGDIKLKSNPRGLYTYLVLFVFAALSPLTYLLMFEDVPLYVAIISFVPAAFVLVMAAVTLFKMKTVYLNEREISLKYPLRRRKVYSYDRISQMICFPPARVPANYAGAGMPVQNVMILTFDDKRQLKLPVLMPGYAEIFEMFSNNTNFQSELAKIAQYYFRFGLDIKNRKVLQENIFPGMGSGGNNGGGETPFAGFGQNQNGEAGPDGGQQNGSDPNNPFDGF